MSRTNFKSYENFLLEMYGQLGEENQQKINKINKTYVRAVNEAKNMTLNEANQILDSIEMPSHIREYIERESNNNFSFNYSASTNTFKLVDLMPMMDESLNEDEEWQAVTEEGRAQLDELIWEGIYTFISSDEGINEGLWGSIVSGAKKAFGYGMKGLKAAYQLVVNGGKILKGMLKTAAQGVGKVLKFAAGVGKKVLGSIQGKAEQRADKLRKHSEEQVIKDTNDLGSTVGWFTGTGIQQGVQEGVKAAGGTAADAASAQSDEKKEILQDLEDKMAEEKGKGKESSQAKKPNESINFEKYAYYIVEYMQTLDKDDLLEFFAFCYASEIAEKSQSLNESLTESFIDNELKKMNLSEGMWDKMKKAFGADKDEEKKEDNEEKTPEEEKKQEELAAKDQEKIKNAEMPDEPEGDPRNRLEDKAKEAEAAAEKGEGGVVKILGWIGRLVIQGPVLIVEWIVEKGLRVGLKFFSACVKKMGGPGVFLMITVAALGAILVGLAAEAVVASGVLGHHSAIAGFFHFSGIAFLAEKAAELALSLAKTAVPILHWVPVALGAYFGVMHLRHILHDIKMGKDVNHSKAIELEEKAAENDRDKAEKTDDEELKKMYQEKADLHDQTVEFHKQMREKKVGLTEDAKKIKEQENTYKKDLGDADDKTKDLIKNLEAKRSALKDDKRQLKDLQSVDTSDMNDDNKRKADDKIKEREENIEKLKKDIEDIQNNIKGEGGEQAAKTLEKLNKLKEMEHNLHHDEESFQKEFDEFFDEKNPESPHYKIKELDKKIKEKESAKKESASSVFSYNDFVKESSKINREDFYKDLRKNSLYEHSSLRIKQVNLEIDEWLNTNMGIQIDEEFEQMMSTVNIKDLSLNEDELFEDRNDLNNKLKGAYDLVGRKFSGFKANVLDRWERWTYKESLPKEVEAAAKDLGVAFDNIIFFRDSDNPDAFNMMIKELPKIDAEFRTGTYKNRNGKVVNYAVVNNI